MLYYTKPTILMKKKIAIICGGPSSEYDVSLSTATSILKFIDREKYIPYVFHVTKDSKVSFYQNNTNKLLPLKTTSNLFTSLKKLSPMHTSIIAMHGEFGEDGKIQSLLDMFNIPYTGSNFMSSALCMDKYRSTLIIEHTLGSKNFKIPETKLLTLKEVPTFLEEATLPICIKPNTKGSSVGVYIVKNKKEITSTIENLRKDFLDEDEFVFQPAIDFDIELSCGCLEDTTKVITYLPPIEIIPTGSKFFDYKSKYSKGGATEITPPTHISKSMAQKISKLAADIHNILGCKLYSRSDFLVKGNTIYYLETNTLPGMTATSLLPQEANAIGISFTRLIDFLIENS